MSGTLEPSPVPQKITLELLSSQNIDAVRAIHREDISEVFVDSVDTIVDELRLFHEILNVSYEDLLP